MGFAQPTRRDGMSVENNFRGFTACRRYATYKPEFGIRNDINRRQSLVRCP
jgi:hypothetical protein